MTTPVIDAHHHLWDPARADYPWMTDDLAPIRRRFDVDDLVPLLDAAGVDATVLVQTRSSAAESREFLATADATPRIAGVVAWADLTSPAVADDARRAPGGPGGDRLVGDPPPGPRRAGSRTGCCAPTSGRGLVAVERAGLVYDLLVRARELPAALEIARTMPGLRLVIDHLAKPPIRDGAMSPWAERLAPFGALPNAWCKLSGPGHRGRLGDLDDRRPPPVRRPRARRVRARIGCCSGRTGRSRCSPRRTRGWSTRPAR